MKRIVALIICALFSLSLLVSCTQPERPLTAAELLDLGEKYLIELNYEQALVQFLAVIEIEPMNPRGYTGAAEAYVGLGDTDKAIAVLRDGLRELPGDANITVALERLVPQSQLQPITESGLKPEMAAQDEVIEMPELTEEEMAFWKTVYTYMTSEDYSGMFFDYYIQEYLPKYNIPSNIQVYEKMKIFSFDGENWHINYTGTGLKLLEFRKFYYGEIVEEKASGNGVGINLNWAYDDAPSIEYYSLFEGEWTNDLPNGKGIYTNKLADIVGEQCIHTYEGFFASGLFHGEIEELSYVAGEIIGYWQCAYDHGNYILDDRWVEEEAGKFLLPSIERYRFGRPGKAYQPDFTHQTPFGVSGRP